MRFLNISLCLCISLLSSCSSNGKKESLKYYLYKEELDSLKKFSQLEIRDKEYFFENNRFDGHVILDPPEQQLNKMMSIFYQKDRSTVILDIRKGSIVSLKMYERSIESYSLDKYLLSEEVLFFEQDGITAYKWKTYKINNNLVYPDHATILYDNSEEVKVDYYPIPTKEIVKKSKKYKYDKLVQEVHYSINNKKLYHQKNDVVLDIEINGEVITLDKEGLEKVTEYDHGIKQQEITNYDSGQKKSVLDVEEGTYKEYYKSGEIKSKVSIRNGKKVGVEHLWYPNGNAWRTFTYKNGVKDGAWKAFYKNGIIGKEGVYSQGLKIAKEVHYYDTGKKWKELSYTYNKIDTLVHQKGWYTNGKLAFDRFLKNSELHGDNLTWYTNGNMRLNASYWNGRKHGYYQKWKENGDLHKSTFYFLNDELESMAKFDSKLEEWGEFEKSVQLDTVGKKVYIKVAKKYVNGQPSEEYVLINGKMHGDRKKWYNDGKLKSASNYFNGKLQGRAVVYNESGRIISDDYYFNGKKLKNKEVFDELLEVRKDTTVYMAYLNKFTKMSNTFTTKENAVSLDPEPIRLTFRYPDNVSLDDKEGFGMPVIKIINDNLDEQLDFMGYVSGFNVFSSSTISMLFEKVKRLITNEAFLANVRYDGYDFFFGQLTRQIRVDYICRSEVTNTPEARRLMVILYPIEKTNGEVSLLLAFDSSVKNPHIRTFEDFGYEGVTGAIWQSMVF